MKIGLLDVDGHNFPNLPLMKLSAYHKYCGDFVERLFALKHYDRVYKSKVFTFTADNEMVYADEIVKGGTGYRIFQNLPEQVEHIYPDYDLYGIKDEAIGFCTRGCPNNCGFCIVPKKEGTIQFNSDITEFWKSQRKITLLDNNIIAINDGIKQLEKIADNKIRLNLTQGIEARKVNLELARLLGTIKWQRQGLRFACDTDREFDFVENAVNLVGKFGIKPCNIFVYMLITNDIDSAVRRANLLKRLGVNPFGQPYRDYSHNNKIPQNQKKVARWINIKSIFNTIDFNEYKRLRK